MILAKDSVIQGFQNVPGMTPDQPETFWLIILCSAGGFSVVCAIIGTIALICYTKKKKEAEYTVTVEAEVELCEEVGGATSLDATVEVEVEVEVQPPAPELEVAFVVSDPNIPVEISGGSKRIQGDLANFPGSAIHIQNQTLELTNPLENSNSPDLEEQLNIEVEIDVGVSE